MKLCFITLMFLGLTSNFLYADEESKTDNCLANSTSTLEKALCGMVPLSSVCSKLESSKKCDTNEKFKWKNICSSAYEVLKNNYSGYSDLQKKFSKEYKEAKTFTDGLCKKTIKEMKTRYYYAELELQGWGEYLLDKKGYEVGYSEYSGGLAYYSGGRAYYTDKDGNLLLYEERASCSHMLPPMFQSFAYLTNFPPTEKCKCSYDPSFINECSIETIIKVPEKVALGIEEEGNKQTANAYIVFKYTDSEKYLAKVTKIIIASKTSGKIYYQVNLK